jgi:hypothetical protein
VTKRASQQEDKLDEQLSSSRSLLRATAPLALGAQTRELDEFSLGGSTGKSRPRPRLVAVPELAVQFEHALALEGGIEEVAETEDLGSSGLATRLLGGWRRLVLTL